MTRRILTPAETGIGELADFGEAGSLPDELGYLWLREVVPVQLCCALCVPGAFYSRAPRGLEFFNSFRVTRLGKW